MLLQGKIAIITGASRGIGKSIAQSFIAQGATVAFTYRSSEEKALELEQELTGNGGTAKGFKSDASKMADAESLVKEVLESFGTVDIVVNNAGITDDTLLMRMTEDQWDRVINVNLKSCFNLTKSVLKTMLKARSGSIINISSVVGVQGNAGQANYAASKAGIIGFSKSLAIEYAKKNININCISPGFIKTDMTARIAAAAIDKILPFIPLKRMGEANDIANMVSYLASSSRMTPVLPTRQRCCPASGTPER